VNAFCVKVDEWSIWSEIFLSRDKNHGFKDLLIEKSTIPSADEKFDQVLDIEKKMARIIEVNEIMQTELILSIN
jgi:hypothetical protein